MSGGEPTAILHIGSWSSRCGNCGLGVDPYAETHETILGYVNNGDPGCGARFTAVSSDYVGDAEAMRRMRPDLPLAGSAGAS